MTAPGQNTEARINRLQPLDLRDDVLEAMGRLGGEAERAEIIREAMVVGQWTAEELAVVSRVRQAARRFHLPTMADHVITTLAQRGEIVSPRFGRWRLAGEHTFDGLVRFGVRYRRATREEREPRGIADLQRDLDELERRTALHMDLQDRLADALAALGMLARSPGPTEPQYDLAFESGEDVSIAEIKTLAGAHHAQQIRLGLGQVVEYRHRMSERLGIEVHALLMLDRVPDNGDWAAILESVGVTLVTEADLEANMGRLLAART